MSLLLAAAPVVRADVCRVTTGGVATNDGSSWALATTLQDALTNGNGKICTEIWVAAGVYKPTTGTDRNAHFSVLPGTAVYGGFAGGETDVAQRDPQANLTVLSGDLDGDDATAVNGVDQSVDTMHNGDNSYQIVVMDGSTNAGVIGADTVLDGFTITAANYFGNGGGLYCNASGANAACSPTLTNLTFSGNYANEGAGIYDYGGSSHGTGVSSPTLVSVTFNGNTANFGAAMFNYAGGTSSPMLTDVTFRNNSAGAAGGVMNNSNSEGTSNPTLVNATFSGNGGIAMINYNATNLSTSTPSLTNVTISGNTGADGAAMANNAHGGVCTPTLSNVIVWGNQATGPAIYNVNGATPTIDHSIVQGSGGSGSWDSSLGTDGGGNLDADPLLGPLADYGGLTQTLRPGGGSAAIDTGNDGNCPGTDQRGVTRPQFLHCDIGAVEFSTFDDMIFNDGFQGP